MASCGDHRPGHWDNLDKLVGDYILKQSKNPLMARIPKTKTVHEFGSLGLRGYFDHDGTFHNMMKDKADHYDLDRLREIPLTEICEKLNIVLDKNNRACCPFHNEDTPSFHINPKNFYKCFGCGAGGDGIKFVQEYMEVDFKEAIEWLANMKDIQPSLRTGLVQKKQKQSTVTPPPTPLTPEQSKQRAYAVSELGAVLWGIARVDPKVMGFGLYAKSRGWSLHTIKRLVGEGSLGCTISGTGLVFNYEHATKVRSDLNDSRSCRWTAGKAKNSVWRAEHLTPSDQIVTIFEGETDLIAAASHTRLSGMIAAPGASWAPDYATRHHFGLHRDVRLAFDNDTAGRNATARLGVAFSGVPGCIIQCFDWDNFKDVGDIGELLKVYGKDSFKKALATNWKTI